jgi:hypothetical protein
MRYFSTDFEEVFDTYLQAWHGKQRAIARREVLHKPEPNIFMTRDRRYRVAGDHIVSPWSWSKNHKGVVRERLFGMPVQPPRPKHRKASPLNTSILDFQGFLIRKVR